MLLREQVYNLRERNGKMLTIIVYYQKKKIL